MEEIKVECEHKRIKSVNCELFCMDCGAKIENTAQAATGDCERVENVSGRKIGFEAEKPKRRARKKAD